MAAQLLACGDGDGDADGDAGESDDLLDEGVMTLEVDGVPRDFLLTVPVSYSGEIAVPLLFNLHQLQGTAEEQLSDSQFDVLAEREGFIVVTPQALMGVWTVTGFPLGGAADDFAFINALIDELSTTYNIDSDRIYATGMSQGGFLAFDLACSFGSTFAAIAPVAGVMTPAMTAACVPERRIPVLQTHGTADEQIDYEASQSAVAWWVDFNGASATPEISELPDTFSDDGTTVDRLVYAGGDGGVDVEHLRVNGGGHVWPGSVGTSDIQMAEEIWSFLSRYDVNGRIDR